MKNYLLILGLLLIFFSCRKTEASPENVYNLFFETPQPINDAELSKIPNKFRGVYINSDSVYIEIKENIILSEYYNKYKFHKNILDSLKEEYDLVDNRYISKLNKDVFNYRYLSDSIEFSNKRIDTFFIFSNQMKAKSFNGQLVINYKDSIFWKVKSIRFKDNILTIREIYSEEDLKRIDSLTKIKSIKIDSSSFIIKPSRNEFKRILNLKHLGFEKNYNRLK